VQDTKAGRTGFEGAELECAPRLVFHSAWKCCLVFASFISPLSDPEKQLKSLKTVNFEGKNNAQKLERSRELQRLYIPRIWDYFWEGEWGRVEKGSRQPLPLIPPGCGCCQASSSRIQLGRSQAEESQDSDLFLHFPVIQMSCWNSTKTQCPQFRNTIFYCSAWCLHIPHPGWASWCSQRAR